MASPTKRPPVSGGELDEHEARIRQELSQLLLDIKRIGPTYPEPQPRCLFSELFDDEQAQNFYEALVGTLKCAKKRGLVRFEGQVLLRGMHDNVVISIAGESPPPPMRLRQDGILETTGNDGLPERTPTKGRRWSKDRAMGAAATGEAGGMSRGGSTPPQKNQSSTSADKPATGTANQAANGRPTFKRLNSLPAIKTSRSDDNSTSLASPTTSAAKLATPTAAQTVSAGVVFSTKKASRTSSADVAKTINARLDAEIARLPADIARIGSAEDAGSPRCSFGALFDDDEVQNHYEALVGTLKSAKRRGVVNYKGQMLLKGMHDEVMIEVIEKDGADEAVRQAVEAVKVNDD
eukprot:CAMPEP_0181031562 /NCGR_PEP_ID=MMETSP1070-20121207/6296_1 /TAXON_ID=265543 /ORGANISM="Minutocellus polymorphus, Strain NH13" /LENGTH=349 /DNA_ID=CAMNT_0023108943 /DNA_START=523 /DNA_END=1572 /DNA_ORIENTATION=+